MLGHGDPRQDAAPDQGARADDVGAAGVHVGQRAPLARPSSRPARRRRRRCRRWTAPRRRRRRGRRTPRSSTPQARVLIVPDVPMAVRRPLERDAGRRRGAASMSARQAATSAGGGRVAVEVPLVEAHRPDVHRDRPALAALAEHQLGRAAADVDHQHRLGAAPGPGRRSPRRRPARPPRHPTAPRARRPAGGVRPRRRRRRCWRRGWPTWRRSGPARGHAVVADHRGELVDRREGALQRLVGQHAGRVDALPEAHDARVAQHDVERAVGADGADQHLDRVGPAVDRRDGARSRSWRSVCGALDAGALTPTSRRARRAPRRRAG